MPYPWIFMFHPKVQEDFVNFIYVFQTYSRIVQTHFMREETRYAKHPDLIPDNPHIAPIIESGLKVGIYNLVTGITRTRLKGKVIVNLEARRNGKTTKLLMSSVDTLQTPFGKALYAQQIYYGTQTDAKKFFHLMKNQLEIDKISANSVSTEGRISRRNNIIEYLYLTAEGENRGHKPVIVYVDEVGFMSNATIDKFMKAVEPSLRDNKANMVFLTSPAESLENTYITDLALDPERSCSQMLPSFLNDAKTEAGNYITSSTDLIATTLDLVKKNQKFMVKTTIFGIPLTYGGREIFRKLNFYVFNKRSLLSQDRYSHIENLTLSSPEEVEKQKQLSDLRRMYGSPSVNTPEGAFSPIKFSFLVSDLSFSGVGDYTVIMHIGVSTSGDLYVLNIFRAPTVATELEDTLVDFLLECLCSPHGEHLVRMYIEGKEADATPRIRTIQNIVKEYVIKNIEPHLNVPNHVTTHKGMSLSTKELKKRLSIKFGYINPTGGYFNDKKTANELLHGNTLNETLILSTSGSKLQRARTAITVLSRRSPITEERVKIVFMCPHTEDYVVDNVLAEILSIEASDLSSSNTKKKTSKNSHDDCLDTLVYGILVAEKLMESVSNGYDIRNNKVTILGNDGSINNQKELHKQRERKTNANRRKIKELENQSRKTKSQSIRSRPYKYS
jgi:hypothetical protein